MKKNEYLTVSIHLKVDGKLKRAKKRTYYARGREKPCFTLNDFAKTIFLYDKMFASSGTYAYDGLLQEMEKKLPATDNETAESLFNKYWVNTKETYDKIFNELNKGNNELFAAENDYLKFYIVQACNNFNGYPILVKYGFLYWFYKYAMNSSIHEIETDLKNIPDEIKKIVDSFKYEKR